MSDGPTRPNAAPAYAFESLRARAKAAGVDLDQLLREVTSRTTRWRISNETASMSTVREIEAAIEARAAAAGRTTHAAMNNVAAWVGAGARLLAASPEKYEQVMKQISEFCDAHEAAEKRMSSILHPLPNDADD